MNQVEAFIERWRANRRSEAANAKAHFLDLCALLGVPSPTSDPTGAAYAFEKEVAKADGRKGYADVWKRECFGWEYKSRGRDLDAAHDQLLRYAGALGNPPLLITSDMDRIVVQTNFTNAVTQRTDYELDDLRDARTRERLYDCWLAPERWRPGQTRQALTEKAAADFAELARRLRERGQDPHAVAHFVNRLVFCLFANDARLLPPGMLGELLQLATQDPSSFAESASLLFGAMRERGGRIGFRPVPWFNGGLFDDDAALPLQAADVMLLNRAAAHDWSQVDPSIMGTLFERGLDPDKRSQLGAHYTDRDKIGLLVGAVVARPLAAEWDAAKEQIAAAMQARAALLREGRESAVAPAPALALAGADAITAETQAARKAMRLAAERRAKRLDALLAEAQGIYRAFLTRLRAFRVLDPACGSGNFLYLALLALKDLELRAGVEAEALGLEPQLPEVGPEAVLGIEVNPYAAELARVSVWIGHIQWARRHGYPAPSNPVLRALDTIECRDAVLAEDGTPASWPKADAIVGNPPFLGTKKQFGILGVDYTERLRAAYAGRIPGFSDLVCYWFERAREEVAEGRAERAGLVATNSIRGGDNRRVLDRIQETTPIFEAWSDEPWTIDGAAVRVSLVCFGAAQRGPMLLDGAEVQRINPDLTAAGADLTRARKLTENARIGFMGTVKGGKFEVPGEVGRVWLCLPVNPNGRPNADVLRPWINTLDVVRRPRDLWIVDFGPVMPEAEATFYAAPFAHVLTAVKPFRDEVRRKLYRERWWVQSEPCMGMRRALAPLARYIATPTVAKHRVFAWVDSRVQPDHQLVAIARDDDTAFGILHSRFHELWALGLGTWLGVGNDPRYTPSTTFETFPFPPGLTPDRPASTYAGDPRAQAIAEAARKLVEARDRWLNPPELVERVPEVTPGFPDRLMPKDDAAAAVLRGRTLTALYNQRGTPEGAWLDGLHRALDAAVADAYGWPADLPDADVLARLLALNAERAAARS